MLKLQQRMFLQQWSQNLLWTSIIENSVHEPTFNQFTLIIELDFSRKKNKDFNVLSLYTTGSSSIPHVKWSELVVSDSLWPHELYSPSNSPGRNPGVSSLSLLQGIFPTQGWNPGLPHCRRILYQLSHKGSPPYPMGYIHSPSGRLLL